MDIWNAIVNEPFLPTMVNNNKGMEVSKLEELWTPLDEKKWSCDWKEKNILISFIDVDEYYRISHYNSDKEICTH
jgi:hypothetical protein